MTKLNNLNFDQTQKYILKMSNFLKLKKVNCEEEKKIKKSNCYKSQKLKLGQHSKSSNVIKLIT